MKYALTADHAHVLAQLPEGDWLRLDAVFPHAPKTVLEALQDNELPLRIATLAVRDDWTLPARTPLAAPFPWPRRILAIGRNYAEHARELGNSVPEEPVVFLKGSNTVIGPGEAVRIPDWVGRVDFEAELMVVLGSGGRNIPEADALAHVVGYTIFNDMTARERSKANQAKGHPWFLPKSVDSFGPMGPVAVTADEITDLNTVRIRLEVDGECRQDGASADMIHSIPALIAYLSRWTCLDAGDVIATGTPAGVGPVLPGQVMSVTIEPIGTLVNPVVAEQGT
jgi:2-keto-4-pentenoate hydratase/2-oxohepta-3-ene-1,7-dioic acid hydratase in catechol pathway